MTETSAEVLGRVRRQPVTETALEIAMLQDRIAELVERLEQAERETRAWRVWKEAVEAAVGAMFSEDEEIDEVPSLDVGAYHSLAYLFHFDFGHGDREQDPALFDALAALAARRTQQLSLEASA